MNHTTFTTIERPLRRDHPAMRLWEKAKRLGIWNPSEINLDRDRRDWEGLTEHEQFFLTNVLSDFQAGEEAVTLDLLPLLQVMAGEGRIEEEMYLTSFLWEEAKHVDFFRRYLDEVAGCGSVERHVSPGAYQTIFYEELPAAMGRLRTDPSPEAQAIASVTYNMIVEGVLAETGYHVYYEVIERHKILPGLREGIAHIQRDEARHIAYGVYLLSRLVADDPAIMSVIQGRMMRMQPLAQAVVTEIVERYVAKGIPFGLNPQEILNFAMSRFASRLAHIMRARTEDPDQIFSALEVG